MKEIIFWLCCVDISATVPGYMYTGPDQERRGTLGAGGWEWNGGRWGRCVSVSSSDIIRYISESQEGT